MPVCIDNQLDIPAVLLLAFFAHIRRGQVMIIAGSDNITREQFATMLMRYCKFAGLDVTAAGNLGAFTDAATISSYAKDALAWANASDIITGRTATTIAPTGSATRGEAATMLMRFVQM